VVRLYLLRKSFANPKHCLFVEVCTYLTDIRPELFCIVFCSGKLLRDKHCKVAAARFLESKVAAARNMTSDRSQFTSIYQSSSKEHSETVAALVLSWVRNIAKWGPTDSEESESQFSAGRMQESGAES